AVVALPDERTESGDVRGKRGARLQDGSDRQDPRRVRSIWTDARYDRLDPPARVPGRQNALSGQFVREPAGQVGDAVAESGVGGRESGLGFRDAGLKDGTSGTQIVNRECFHPRPEPRIPKPGRSSFAAPQDAPFSAHAPTI